MRVRGRWCTFAFVSVPAVFAWQGEPDTAVDNARALPAELAHGGNPPQPRGTKRCAGRLAGTTGAVADGPGSAGRPCIRDGRPQSSDRSGMVATPQGGRPGLSPDARALVEEYLWELVRTGRLRDLARSRGDLAAHYRARGDDAASYCLAVAPDFSLTETAAGDVLMRLRRSGHLVSWTRSELLDHANRPSEGENCAKQLPPAPTDAKA